MKKIIIFVVTILSIVLLVITSNKVDGKIKYDNTSNALDLISQTYTTEEISDLKEKIETNSINFSQFKSQYNIQCIRKTYQGYYVVLLQDDGKHAFVFMDEQLNIYNIFVIDKFREQKDFDFILQNKTKKSEALLLSSNMLHLPISSMDTMVYFIKEGIFIIGYQRNNNGILLEDPVVNFTQFVSNQELLKTDDEFISKNIPLILDIDKLSSPLELPVSVESKHFESINIGESIDNVQKIDPLGDYIFLYTGRNDFPKISTHYTSDGYIIGIHYDEDYHVIKIDKLSK